MPGADLAHDVYMMLFQDEDIADLVHAMHNTLSKYCPALLCHALSARCPVRFSCAVSGTNAEYAATRFEEGLLEGTVESTDEEVSPYDLLTYAPAMQSPVLADHAATAFLRFWYAKSSTDALCCYDRPTDLPCKVQD
eukprot:2748780-Rhodomonas_salina.4